MVPQRVVTDDRSVEVAVQRDKAVPYLNRSVLICMKVHEALTMINMSMVSKDVLRSLFMGQRSCNGLNSR